MTLESANATKAPFAPLIGNQRAEEIRTPKIRPQLVHHHEFRVRDLPEEKVGDAHFAGRSDEQIGITELRMIEELTEHFRRHVLGSDLSRPRHFHRAARRARDLRARAVTEGQIERQACVPPGRFDGSVQPAAGLLAQVIQLPGCHQRDIVFHQFGQFVREELIEQLRGLADATSKPIASATTGDLRIAFVCSGQGPQWWAMGRQLLAYCPEFREVIDSCGREFSRYGNWSLFEELSRSEETSRMQQTHIAQPSLFAIQVGLAAVCKSWGIKPAVIAGHSVGEIAAAYLAGALTFGDACAVAFHRGRTMDLASSRGAMLAVGLSVEEIRPKINGLENELAIAAINGPSSLTLSGSEAAINRLFDQLSAAGVFCRKLKVEYAFHSSQMDAVRDELLRSLSGIKPKANHTELISTVTGKAIDGRELTNEYWWKNVRCSVLFLSAMTELAAEPRPWQRIFWDLANCTISQTVKK